MNPMQLAPAMSFAASSEVAIWGITKTALTMHIAMGASDCVFDDGRAY
jgi:hypothetical protein